MLTFLNNCTLRDHVRLYGPEAFYDLKLTGPHATKATDLKRGNECIVATYAPNGNVVFSWFSFSHENIMPDGSGAKFRVFFGKFIKSESFSKWEATKTEPYSVFFNVRGDFKQLSVIRPKDIP